MTTTAIILYAGSRRTLRIGKRKRRSSKRDRRNCNRGWTRSTSLSIRFRRTWVRHSWASTRTANLCGRIEGGFCVQDDGIGVDMRYAHKIFRPFERLHRDVDYAGTGIGLAKVQRIVERHGGRIWVESKLGKGATFFVQLSSDAP